MPPAFRSEFPRLTVDVHVFDSNPLRRFVMLNGKKYRETDTTLDGPRIIEITPEGVVLEHRGSQVLVELPR
jgi:general secretion pathway protein B